MSVGRPRGEVPAELRVEVIAAHVEVVQLESELEQGRARVVDAVKRAAAAGGSVRSIAELLETSPASVARMLTG